MKKIYSFVILLFFVFTSFNTFAQKLYDDINPITYTHGKRLTLTSNAGSEPLDFLSYKRNDSMGITEFKMSIGADYRQWKFTEKLLVAGYAKGNFLRIWSKTPQGPDTGNLGFSRMLASLYGAMSYYITPNQFYVTGAVGGGYDYFRLNRDFQETEHIDTNVSSSAVWGALGYGRINNREVVEYAYDFDEALRNRGIINRKLDDKTLMTISKLLYQQRDGMFLDQYEDDEFIQLFGQIERALLNAGYISGSLDAASAIKLYEILRNTSRKYIFYPKYSGYQVQSQVQYQLSNIEKSKPHEHYLSFSGIYCFNLARQTNLVLSGFYSIPLDSMALGSDMRTGSNFENVFQNYLPFLPDRNNLDFFREFHGTGVFGRSYVPGLQSLIGIRADVFHSLSSFAGIQGNILISDRMFKYADSKLHFGAAARFDYNIYSSLTSYAKGTFITEKGVPPSYTIGFGFGYRVF
jgi:hypothetical protein